MAYSSFGDFSPLRTILKHGRDVRLTANATANNNPVLTIAATIGLTGTMETQNNTGEYLEIVGWRIGSVDADPDTLPFIAYVEVAGGGAGGRQWSQDITGVGVHSAFLGVNGPWGTPLFWSDMEGPGATHRNWGMRGLAPRERLRITVRNMSAAELNVRCEFICQTRKPDLKQALPYDLGGLQREWNKWNTDFLNAAQAGSNGDEHLFTRQGIWKFFPLWDRDLFGANVDTTVAQFGAIRLAANGVSGPLTLPFPGTKEGLVLLRAMLATSTGNFRYEISGGGYNSVRMNPITVLATGNDQWGAGRTLNRTYYEAVMSIPRPYNVQDPPAIELTDISGAQNDIRIGFVALSMPPSAWEAGGGSR